MTSKRSLLVAFIVGAFFTVRPAHAWIFQEVPDKAVTVHYRLSVAAGVSTDTVVISLSSTTVWPHKETGEINLDAIRLDVDKVAASSGTVKLGVVNYVDTATGTVTWIWSREFAKNVSNTDVSRFNSYLPCFLKLRVNPNGYGVDGSLPYIFSSTKAAGSTTFQSDVVIPSPANVSIAPAVGDLILEVVNSDGTNAIVVTVDLTYHSNAR